jgi:hypothetical protein
MSYPPISEYSLYKESIVSCKAQEDSLIFFPPASICYLLAAEVFWICFAGSDSPAKAFYFGKMVCVGLRCHQ